MRCASSPTANGTIRGPRSRPAPAAAGTPLCTAGKAPRTPRQTAMRTAMQTAMRGPGRSGHNTAEVLANVRASHARGGVRAVMADRGYAASETHGDC